MSFGDLIGKLQSVVSSFGTEETKKTEKKEDVSDNSVFAAAIENVNEETDITGIEIDYSQAADEVADQLFINRNIHRNAEEAKEWSERVNQELDSANIPESLKDELAPLYGQLCEATDSNQREYISAKIKQKYLEAEANGEDGANFEKLDLDLQRFSSFSAQGKAISELNEKLAEANDYKTRNKIYDEIDKTNADFSIEQEKLFMQSYIREFDLQEEQVDGLSDLYLKLGETIDESEKDQIQAEIKLFCAQQGIDPNSEMILGLDMADVSLAGNQELSLLYEEAMNTKSDKQLDMIYREINLKKSENIIKSNEVEQKMIVAGMDVDEQTKEDVFELFDELSAVNDRHQADRIYAEIAHSLAKSGVDLDSQDCTLLQLTLLGTQMEKENLSIYEQMMETTDPSLINELNTKLSYIYESYQQEFNGIHERLQEHHNQNFVNNLGEMYKDLSNATSAEERERISSEIKKAVNDENELILENKILDSYWDLYESTDEADQARNIAEIQSLHSQYKDMKLEEKLSNLYDDLSATTDISARDKIKAEIKKVENEMNKKAELESLYEQLAECSSVGEREKILAKIKELE